MIRNVKALGLAVVAVFAMSAMVASAAQANNYWFTSDAAAGVTTFLTGEQVLRQPGNLTDEFTTTAGVVKCSGATYTGSGVGPTQSTITVHPVYTGCTAFGFSAEITTTGCNYVFHAATETAGGIYHATTTIECSGANEITVVAKVGGITKCTVHVESGQDVGLVQLTKGTIVGVPNVKDIHVDVNLGGAAPNGIKYTETKGEGAGACATSTTQSDGTYKGTVTLTGFSDAAHKNRTDIDLG